MTDQILTSCPMHDQTTERAACTGALRQIPTAQEEAEALRDTPPKSAGGGHALRQARLPARLRLSRPVERRDQTNSRI